MLAAGYKGRCAARGAVCSGVNIRWLLRAIQGKGLKALLAALFELWRRLGYSGRTDPPARAGLENPPLIAITQQERPWLKVAVGLS
jgi:GNAT superfamily N-acetyltransferase